MDPAIEAERRRAEEEAAAFFRAAPPLRDRDSIAASVADFVARRSTGKSSSPNSPNGLSPSSLPSSPTNATQQMFDRFPFSTDPPGCELQGPEEGPSVWCASHPAAPRCHWSSDACATSTISAPASEGPRPLSIFSRLATPSSSSIAVGASSLTVDFFQRIHFLLVSSSARNQRSKPALELMCSFELLISVTESHNTVVKAAISNYRKAIDEGQLLKLPFTTIFEYLQLLQMVSTAMNGLEQNGMFYLAAAVSDFYVPWDSMAKHKIQSAGGPLNMQLSQVPKMLFILRNHWAPSAFCVSFKLETDPNILLQKAEMALRKYGMNVVVANELANYKDVVVMVTSSGRTTVSRPSKEDDVEEQLVDLLVKMHSDHIVQPN